MLVLATVILAAQSDREWALLCHEILHRDDLIGDMCFARNTDRVANNAQITLLLEEAFSRFAGDELMATLDRIGIANARVRTPQEFAEHPQLTERQRWRTVEWPGGTIQALAPPVMFREAQPNIGGVPMLGEHNMALRTEFGEAREV
jgi:itaconate CoA-transferase